MTLNKSKSTKVVSSIRLKSLCASIQLFEEIQLFEDYLTCLDTHFYDIKMYEKLKLNVELQLAIGLQPLFFILDVFRQRDRFGKRDIYRIKQKKSSRCLPGVETNRPNTHAKFKLDWFSGFLKKL